LTTVAHRRREGRDHAAHACVAEGDEHISFTAISNRCLPAPCPSRTFARFSRALQEIIDARVWSGIHFRTADVQGAVLGKRVQRYMEKHFFEPVS
jgi:hypothetical protein